MDAYNVNGFLSSETVYSPFGCFKEQEESAISDPPILDYAFTLDDNKLIEPISTDLSVITTPAQNTLICEEYGGQLINKVSGTVSENIDIQVRVFDLLGKEVYSTFISMTNNLNQDQVLKELVKQNKELKTNQLYIVKYHVDNKDYTIKWILNK